MDTDQHLTEDFGTATWRYWHEVYNAAAARSSYQDHPPAPVRARVVFDRDGEAWLDGRATRLGFDGTIFVELVDRRIQVVGAWFAPGDVWWAAKR